MDLSNNVRFSEHDSMPRAPEPPWRAKRRKGSRVPITRETIVEAGLRVLERVGMDALSMRLVADELRTGAASLYWHVRNKDELLQLLFERLNDEIELPEPDPMRWQEQVKMLGRRVRDLAHRRRDYARLSLGRIPSGPSLARFAEWMFQLLVPVGVPDHVIAYAGDLFSLYVGAFAFEESLGPPSPTGEPLAADQIGAMFRDYLQSLPTEQFPHVQRTAGLLFAGDTDARFEFGMEVLVRGIESHISARHHGA